jgi:restriction endonuclease S subunit
LNFGRNFELKKIGSFLTRNKTAITVEDNVSYKRVTIKTNNGGCCLRDELYGKYIGTKQQFVISQGQFILSKIDARNGAMGVVPLECDNAIITGNFWTFDVNEKLIDSHYLSLVTTTRAFVNFAEKASNGTTNRHYLQEPLFLSQKIPLPAIDMQRTLVSAYNDKISQSEAFEKRAAQMEQEIEDYLLSELGIRQKSYTQAEPTATVVGEPQMEYVVSNRQREEMTDAYHWGDEIKKEYRYLKFVKFKEIERWDVVYFTQKNSFKGNYENIPMNECINSFMQDFQGNSLRIETSKYPENSYQYIGMENIEKGTGVLTEEKIIKGSEVKSQTVRVPKDFFLYGKLRPYLNKYWYNESENENIVCSSEFFVFSIKKSINPYYFKYYLSSSAVQQQITNAYRGARMPRINEETFKAVAVPLPPINIQNSIVEHISKQMEQINGLKKQADNLRKEALEEFERKIFE